MECFRYIGKDMAEDRTMGTEASKVLKDGLKILAALSSI